MSKPAVRLVSASPTLDEGMAFAKYLDQAAEGFFGFMLGKCSADILAKAFIQPGHDLSYKNVTFAKDDENIVGMVATTIAFFLLERILQSYLAPFIFPNGKLYDVRGTRRINLTVRLLAVFVAINLIPFTAILTSLYRVSSSERDAIESLGLLSTGLWILIPVAIAIGGTLILILTFNLKKSLDAMVDVLKQITIGNFSTRVKVTSNDEIGYVGDIINEMTEGLMERDRMRQSLDLAMEVQQNLLPKKNLVVEGFDIAGKSLYCDETGGDYYDFFSIDDTQNNTIGIAIGDVSGHGVPAALLMATVRSSLRQRMSLPGSIAQIISDVNAQLVNDVEDSGQFMTLYYLSIDPSRRDLEWVRAGHDPGILYDPATDTIEELKGNGIALGVDDAWLYEANEKKGFEEDQIIVLCTDGVWEAHNKNGEAFGKKRLYETIRNNSSRAASEMVEAVFYALEKFQTGYAIEDDITLVVIKVG